MSDWSFPLSSLDLRHLVQNLLNDLVVEEPIFTNNLPGREFVYHFLISNEEPEESRLLNHTTKEDAGASNNHELPIKPLLVSNWIDVEYEAATTSRAVPKKQHFVGKVVKKVSNSVYEI